MHLDKWIFDKAYATKIHNLHTYGKYDHWLYDKLVFNKIKMLLTLKQPLIIAKIL